jgi:hypothetical protein
MDRMVRLVPSEVGSLRGLPSPCSVARGQQVLYPCGADGVQLGACSHTQTPPSSLLAGVGVVTSM